MSRISRTEAVRSVSDAYVDGVRRGDAALLADLFHPDAQMYGHLDGAPTNMPIGGFFAMPGQFTAPADSGEPYRAVVAAITVGTTAAVAELHEEDYLGRDFTDFSTLLEVDGRWLIVDKAYEQVR
jgi:hypothetical protein